MQANIHPAYHEVGVTCSCGNQFNINSTQKSDKLALDVCNKCHPFYTGKSKEMDTGGRLGRFRDRYKKKDS